MQKRISSQSSSDSQRELVMAGAAVWCLILGETQGSYLRWILNTEQPHTSARVLYFMDEDKKMNMKIKIPCNRKKSIGFVVYPVRILAACCSPGVLRTSQGPLSTLGTHPLVLSQHLPQAQWNAVHPVNANYCQTIFPK